MSCTKRFMSVFVLVTVCILLPDTVFAAVNFSGDYSPTTAWSGTTTGYIGNTANGTLSITAGAPDDLLSANAYIGNSAGVSGLVIVDGTGSSWANGNTMYVGNSGTGALWIQNGGSVSSSRAYVGNMAGSAGTVTVNGAVSEWLNTGPLYIGNEGNGALAIQSSGTVTAQGDCYIGNYSTGVVDVDGGGSLLKLENSKLLILGQRGAIAGNGIINITNGGGVEHAGEVRIGSSNGGGGTVTVNGPGSQLINNTSTTPYGSTAIYVGYNGNGMLEIQNGGLVTNAGSTYVTKNATSTGAISFASGGGTLSTRSLYALPSHVTGTGTIVTNGLVSDVALSFSTTPGYGLSQTVSGFGSSTMTLDMSNSDNVGSLGAGFAGTGTLAINGITVHSAGGELGCKAGSSGTATVDGTASQWINDGELYVGNAGSGMLNVKGGGTVTVANGQGVSIGCGAGPTSTVTVDGVGSTLNASGTDSSFASSGLNVGYYGSGQLNVTNGGNVNSSDCFIGYMSAGSVSVSGSGSTWTNTGAIYGTLYVGLMGDAELNIADNGTVVANHVSVGSDYGMYTNHTLNFDGGILKAYNTDNANWISLGAGYMVSTDVYIKEGGATFDTAGYNMGIALSLQHAGGSATDGGITKSGNGTLTLTGANSYNGHTVVEAGVLELGTDAQSVVLTGGGADIHAGKMVFQYSGAAPGVASLLTASYSGGTAPWTTGQFLSTTADGNHGLGWVDDGVDEVTVMYTLYGDSNLDGSVNGTDLNAVLSYYNQSSEIWNHGDFNYDGSVNGTDLNTVLSNYNQSLSSSTAAVPEPSTLLLLLLGVVGMLAWRKRFQI